MIKFNDNGTISVPIGGETLTLKRPTMQQLWDGFDLREELTATATAQMSEWAQELAELDDDDERATELAKQLRNRRFAFEFISLPWLQWAFEQCGSKPLPEDLSEAPSELADPKLPGEILLFWRDVPLVPSTRRQ